MSEADLMRAVTDLATILGWEWAHFRPAQTSKGWRTPVSGPLGKGWPDLTLVRERDRRLLFVELKGTAGVVSAEQRCVHHILGAVATAPGDPKYGPRVEVAIWHPADLDSGLIAARLR